ncbi:MAG TPA: hypothetical protein VEO54_21915 [Thermoanaerobaculia bacterium]|nr:hypothetical protein [Thermoanaerobaculia bacterium]
MDLEKLVAAFKPFGADIPQYVLLAASVLGAILGLLFLIARVAREIKPLFYDAGEKRRVRRRRRFAEHVRNEIGRIDHGADWSEHQYAELEAEVEAEGRRRSWLGFRRSSCDASASARCWSVRPRSRPRSAWPISRRSV